MMEIIVDSFAGGGGASTGIEMALGRSPDIAINHDAVALSMHQANHPQTLHLTADIWSVDPVKACGGRPVGLLWASPDCKHFSKAKGGKPVEKSIRGLAWVVVHWANTVAPRVIILENVEEFATWGPLGADGRPCPARKGITFRRWVGQLERLGYAVEWRELRACDYGAPTIRKRLFLIARRDGEPIVWPEPTHGAPDSEGVRAGRLKPWRTAAEIIDWSLPCPSIFDSAEEIMAKHGLRAQRPLQPATLARIAKGVKRYVLDAAKPFIVPITHVGDERTYAIDDPLRTITTASRGEQALIAPHLTKFRENSVGASLDDPAPTVTANSFVKRPGGAAPIGVVAAFLAQHNVENGGGAKAGRPVDVPLSTVLQSGSHQAVTAAFLAQHNYLEPGHDARTPLSTIVAKGSTQAVVAANLSHQYGSATNGGQGRPDHPLKTIATGGHHAVVASFLQKYYGADQDPRLEDPLHTATTLARFGLVTVTIDGEPYVIVDIGMRMLTPRELFRAQGFPDSYIIDRGADGAPITKTQQVAKCGNSVCPPMAAALVKANYAPRMVSAAPLLMEAAE